MKQTERKQFKRLYRKVAIEVVGKKLMREKPLTIDWLMLADIYRQLIYDDLTLK